MSSLIDHTLTLVLAKSCPDIMARALDAIAATSWTSLSEHKAVDIPYPTDNPKACQAQISDLFHRLHIPADICIQANAGRRKSLLICDMDSTLIGQECIDELADFAGVKPRVAAITERAMRGEIGFEGALTERVGLLIGLALASLQNCYEQRIFLNPGARTLARTMQASGARTVIVSGGFTFFASRVAEDTGFAHYRANQLLDDGDKLTGKVAMPILGRQAKLDALNAFSGDIGGPNMAVAIGDGANDLAMIKAAGLGIAYRAKPAVAAAAQCAVNYSDLTTALYFQGFKDEEFILD